MSVPILGVALVGTFGALVLLLDPTATFGSDSAAAVGYLVVMAAGFTVAALLMINSKARAYFTKS